MSISASRYIAFDLECAKPDPEVQSTSAPNACDALRESVGPMGRALCRLGHARDVLGDLASSLAASPTLRAISFVVAFCSSTAVAIVLEMSFTCLITELI